jgi:hypothetical protein
MAGHMKMTIEIPDRLFKQARELAATERTTLDALVEEGFRLILSKRRRSSGLRITICGVGLFALAKKYGQLSSI